MLHQQSLTKGKLSERAKAIEFISSKINCHNNIEDILAILTKETRRLLECDRLIVYQFMSDWSGKLVAESVGAGWKSLLIEPNSDESSGDRCIVRNKLAVKADIVEPDTFLRETKGGKYAYETEFSAIDNIYNKGFPNCYLKSLEKYQAKAYLMVPIYQNKKLWGLLGAYQNDSPRVWQSEEIDLTKKIIDGLASSLQQIERRSLNDFDLATNSNKQPLGEILVAAGLVSIRQIEIALQEQKAHQLKIGHILSNHGWIKAETADFFAEKWSSLIEKRPNRPLALYLFAAALLNREQLLVLKQQQQQADFKTELHSLAVKQGYVKKETVNYFFKHLYEVKQTSGLSFTKSYEIIKSYLKGETNFQNKELSQAPLNGVSLKGVVLDNSNLVQANLNKTNLYRSSLVRVNLTLANLESANLSHVNFTQACLIEANLRNSNLERANFHTVNLQEADLREANLLDASFAGADLRGAKLEPVYNYSVYYDRQTRFDPNFDPIKSGWKLR